MQSGGSRPVAADDGEQHKWEAAGHASAPAKKPALEGSERENMANIPIGTSGEEKLLVGSDVAIDFLGMEGARVLSTPHMIGYMERTCRNTVLPLLEPGYDTVGTHVNVAHLGPRPWG